uniref:Uncharacterized protein n=1 Tax=Globisporangium ultimum (strain ATCC 200006 / CBS 805.95 / DAOM BR144) TaxID=431595 RepID=K3WN11_GLOUD
MSVIKALQYLSRSENGDDEDGGERQRPTPLDPEYWRGITHSHDMAPHPIHMQEGTYFSPSVNDNYAYAAHPQIDSWSLTVKNSKTSSHHFRVMVGFAEFALINKLKIGSRIIVVIFQFIFVVRLRFIEQEQTNFSEHEAKVRKAFQIVQP